VGGRQRRRPLVTGPPPERLTDTTSSAGASFD